MKVTERLRWWAGGILGFALTAAIGPLVNVGPYRTPIFRTVRAIAPWDLWAAWWLTVAVFAAVTVATRRAWAWRAATVGCIAVGGTWLFAICWEHWVNGAPITPTGLALWSWFLASNLLVTTSSRQFEVW